MPAAHDPGPLNCFFGSLNHSTATLPGLSAVGNQLRQRATGHCVFLHGSVGGDRFGRPVRCTTQTRNVTDRGGGAYLWPPASPARGSDRNQSIGCSSYTVRTRSVTPPLLGW